MTDPATRADYQAAPDRFLDSRGFGGLDADDVTEALTHATAVLPPALAVQVEPEEGLDTLTQVEHGPFDDGPAAGDAAFDDDDGPFRALEDDRAFDADDDGPDDLLSRDVDFDRPADGAETAPVGGSTDDPDVTDAPAAPAAPETAVATDSPTPDSGPDADSGAPPAPDTLTDPSVFADGAGQEAWFPQPPSFDEGGYDGAGFDDDTSDILDDVDTLGDHHDG